MNFKINSSWNNKINRHVNERGIWLLIYQADIPENSWYFLFFVF